MEDDEIHSENEGNGASIERNAENDVNMEDFGGDVRTANLVQSHKIKKLDSCINFIGG